MFDFFRTQSEIIDKQLAATRARIFGAARVAGRDDSEWLRECASRERLLDAYDDDRVPASWIRTRLCLTVSEARVVWVLLAHELCAESRAALRALATENEPDVTLDVLRRIVYGHSPIAPAWRELALDSALRRLSLVEVHASADSPMHRATVRVSRRLLALVHGHVAIDDELAEIAEVDNPEVHELVVDQQARASVYDALQQRSGLVIVHGRRGIGRRSLVRTCAAELGIRTLVVDARKLAEDRVGLSHQLRLVRREAALLGCTPVFLHLDALASSASDRLATFENEAPRNAIATAAEPIAYRWRIAPKHIHMRNLHARERASLWSRAIQDASADDAQLLATMYPLAPGLIGSVGRVVQRLAGQRQTTPRDIRGAVGLVVEDAMAGLATRVRTNQTWEDLILPDEQTLAVAELLARIRQRDRVYEDWGFAKKLGKGLGITALFSGPPGTGKTLCAGLIANDLGVELYQVDTSQLVSKWIGETEKNLGKLFDAAESGHAMLLFDEAEAIFGKRTDVRSSNDRHANEQTNYLLQRLERFTGICILTTNHEHAMDEAFRRRLAVNIRLPVPDADERENLWRRLMPTEAPVNEGVDFSVLARKFTMSGGYIRNAILRAAFLAADANERIDNYYLMQAAQLEYEAMGKLAVAEG